MDAKPQEEARILESFKVCRSELQHEYNVLANRLNSYITSQAFLVSGYAISMGNMVPGAGATFRLLFPLMLSLVGILLSIRAHPGISGACGVIGHWHAKEAKLFDKNCGLGDYDVLRKDDVRAIHDRNLLFAQTSPWIFGIAWLLMAVLAIYLHGLSS